MPAIAVGQLTLCQLTVRHRRQASSHILMGFLQVLLGEQYLFSLWRGKHLIPVMPHPWHFYQPVA